MVSGIGEILSLPIISHYYHHVETENYVCCGLPIFKNIFKKVEITLYAKFEVTILLEVVGIVAWDIGSDRQTH